VFTKQLNFTTSSFS